VTGVGFNVSTFLSNIQYRAWGAPKSVAHKDGRTTETTYDSRLRVATYKLLPAVPDDGVRMYNQYEYFPDGRLKKLNDLDDHDPSISGVTDSARWFSRVYSYDNRGRILKARGWNPNGYEFDFPFEQFYSYDAFNHMTSRSGSYYYQPDFSDSGTYLNDRRQDWTFGADGQETHSTGPGMFRDLIYNAAGKMIQVKETQTANNQFSTYLASYDGDGKLAMELLQEDPTNTKSYKVRSSVLGEVLTHLDNAGNKTGTTVHIDKRVTTARIDSSAAGFVGFPVYEDPLHQSIAGDKKAVYDPLGNLIPWRPWPGGPPPNFYPRSSSQFGSLGSSFGSAQERGCAFSEVPISCQMAAHLTGFGVNNAAGNATGSGPSAITFPGDPLHPPDPVDWHPDFIDWVRRTGRRLTDENFLSLGSAWLAQLLGSAWPPQNTALNPFLVNRIKQELEESDCATFAQTIMNQLAPEKGSSLVDVFDAFLKQPKPHDLLTRTTPSGSWGEASAIGSIKESTAYIFARKVNVNQTKADADNIIAELFHLARMNGSYTDKQLANAARRTPYASEAANYLAPSANVFDRGYKPGGWNEQNQYGYSVYFHTIQKQHCGFRPPTPWK
jgi:hypothetical protein